MSIYKVCQVSSNSALSQLCSFHCLYNDVRCTRCEGGTPLLSHPCILRSLTDAVFVVGVLSVQLFEGDRGKGIMETGDAKVSKSKPC